MKFCERKIWSNPNPNNTSAFQLNCIFLNCWKFGQKCRVSATNEVPLPVRFLCGKIPAMTLYTSLITTGIWLTWTININRLEILWGVERYLLFFWQTDYIALFTERFIVMNWFSLKLFMKSSCFWCTANMFRDSGNESVWKCFFYWLLLFSFSIIYDQFLIDFH